MDTKKKTRTPEANRRDRSEAKPKAASGTRSRQQPAKRPPQTERRREQTSRRPEQTAQHRRQEPRRTRESAPDEETLRRRQAAREAENAPRRQPVAETPSDAPEMVFHMDGREERMRERERAPRDPAEAKRAQQRKRSAQRTQERQKQAARRSKAPKVTYTQPRPINANRLLLQLAVVMAVVIAISLGLSVFFKVENVMVYGNKAYSAWAVQEASGIEGGEKLLTFGNIRACGKIKAALPYVDTVRIGINLPDTVNIYITEYDVAYAVKDQNSAWWLMTSDGRVVEQTDSGTASGYTRVLGVELSSPVAGEQAMAYEEPVAQVDATGATGVPDATEATAPVTVTAAEKLTAALNILDALERNDLVGEVASVDVSSLTSIEMWYGNQYQVRLGSANDPNHDLDYKIAAMKASVAQLSDYQTGILDVSYTTWTDQVGYTPFE